MVKTLLNIKIEEEFHITDLETLKVISDPLRVQILERIGLASDAGQPITVKQLAEELDRPPTKLYYHVNLLEKHELIRVAETQVVSGIIERHYQIRAKKLRADLDISKNTLINRDEGMALALSSIQTMFNTAYKNLADSFQERLKDTEDGENDPVGMLSSQATMQLSPDEAQEFVDEINTIINKYADINNPNGLPFGLTLVFNPNYHLKTKRESPEPNNLNQIPSIDNKEPHFPPQL
jgi:DNA-binding transcriptional ArsR family regulator